MTAQDCIENSCWTDSNEPISREWPRIMADNMDLLFDILEIKNAFIGAIGRAARALDVFGSIPPVDPLAVSQKATQWRNSRAAFMDPQTFLNFWARLSFAGNLCKKI